MFNSVLAVAKEAERDIINVLVCDEAHRLRPSSSDRLRPALNTGTLRSRILGRDLRYDPQVASWSAYKTKSHDTVVKRQSGVRFDDLVKNTYRVLLTRGLKGCYVYFQDEATKTFVLSRVERTQPGAS